jgi:xanthine dehydrogenase accessory factor
MEQVDATIVQSIPRPATVIIVGGADIAVHLVQLATQTGFETVLIDPRAVFTGEDRFPVQPTQLHTKWPQEVLPGMPLDKNTFAVLLTHDPKIDDPALEILFDSDVPYIGALGGRKTQATRRERLAGAGHSQENINRIKGPVGLKIGAATPAEIAVSILAEIIQVRNGR